jgi:AraC-like DNA-binding protein
MDALALDLRSYPGTMRSHDHPHHQVVLGLQGILEMEIDGQGGRVDLAQGALVPVGTRHAFAGVGANRFVTLDIPAGDAAGGDCLFGERRPFFAISQPVAHLLAFIRSRGADAAVQRDRIAPLLAGALAADLAPGRAAAPLQLCRAVDFLRRSFGQTIDNADVAAAAGVSAARLHVLFREWMNTSPGRYLLRLRLEHAREQLLGGRETIAEIALTAGFSEQSAFSRAFRRRFGDSPAAFRRSRLRRR